MAETEETAPSTRRRKTASPTKEGVRTPTSKRRGELTGGLALILAVIALIGSAYLWYSLVYERRELLRTDVLGTLEELTEQGKETSASLQSAEEDLALMRENQDTIRSALDKIQNDLAQNRIEWALTEAERLLVIANHRLQLARDVESAISALRAADRQLVLIANPSLVPIRREIARELVALEAIEKTDVTGIALRLSNLTEAIDRLPLAPTVKPPTAKTGEAKPATDWRDSARHLWSDLLSLVRIRHDGPVPPPLLPPEQHYFLRENLRLMLYGAQQGILQGNAAVYRQNLQTARRWLQTHFDAQAQPVVGALTELERLSAARIAAELPKINGSLEALRRLPGRKPAT